MLRECAGPVAIIAATHDSLRAEDDGGAAIAAHLGVDPPADWPPEYNDAATRARTAELLAASPDNAGWGAWYIVADGRLVGTCGYRGPPVDGLVEIGYSVIAADQRRGHASAAVALLVARAWRDPRIEGVTAETLASGVASQRVLLRSGFARAGKRADPDEGEVLRFLLHRPG